MAYLVVKKWHLISKVATKPTIFIPNSKLNNAYYCKRNFASIFWGGDNKDNKTSFWNSNQNQNQNQNQQNNQFQNTQNNQQNEAEAANENENAEYEDELGEEGLEEESVEKPTNYPTLPPRIAKYFDNYDRTIEEFDEELPGEELEDLETEEGLTFQELAIQLKGGNITLEELKALQKAAEDNEDAADNTFANAQAYMEKLFGGKTEVDEDEIDEVERGLRDLLEETLHKKQDAMYFRHYLECVEEKMNDFTNEDVDQYVKEVNAEDETDEVEAAEGKEEGEEEGMMDEQTSEGGEPLFVDGITVPTGEAVIDSYANRIENAILVNDLINPLFPPENVDETLKDLAGDKEEQDDLKKEVQIAIDEFQSGYESQYAQFKKELGVLAQQIPEDEVFEGEPEIDDPYKEYLHQTLSNTTESPIRNVEEYSYESLDELPEQEFLLEESPNEEYDTPQITSPNTNNSTQSESPKL